MGFRAGRAGGAGLFRVGQEGGVASGRTVDQAAGHERTRPSGVTRGDKGARRRATR